MKITLILLHFFTTLIYAQSNDPDLILDKVKQNFNRVKDYQVDVSIKVDVDFIKVPDMKARLYFKEPDKMQLDSEGFAMLPKGGVNFSPASLLSGKYSSILEKKELQGETETAVIKVIPLGDAGDVVLSTLQVDIKNYRIMKVETTTKTQGTFQIELKYPEGAEYPLPSSMTFLFNIEKMNLPKGMDGELNTSAEKNKERMTSGKVFISYSNYKVNRGIPDEVFKDPKKKP